MLVDPSTVREASPSRHRVLWVSDDTREREHAARYLRRRGLAFEVVEVSAKTLQIPFAMRYLAAFVPLTGSVPDTLATLVASRPSARSPIIGVCPRDARRAAAARGACDQTLSGPLTYRKLDGCLRRVRGSARTELATGPILDLAELRGLTAPLTQLAGVFGRLARARLAEIEEGLAECSNDKASHAARQLANSARQMGAVRFANLLDDFAQGARWDRPDHAVSPILERELEQAIRALGALPA